MKKIQDTTVPVPVSKEQVSEKPKSAKTKTLPSGKILTFIDFKGKHVIEAQRLMGGDADKYLFAMCAVCAKIDGKRITIEELEEMNGMDALSITTEFATLFM